MSKVSHSPRFVYYKNLQGLTDCPQTMPSSIDILRSALLQLKKKLLSNQHTPNPEPKLPSEILHLIIEQAWHLTFTKSSRIHFMTCSTLVNRTWLKLFILTSFKDLVFPCAAYFDWIFSTVVPGHSKIITPLLLGGSNPAELLQTLCRSLTFYMEDSRDRFLCSSWMYCDHGHIRGCTEPLLYPMLYKLQGPLPVESEGRQQDDNSSPILLPNVRRLDIKFHNILPSRYDISRTFAAIRKTGLYRSVVHLEIEYDWNPETPRCVLTELSSFSEIERMERLRNGIVPKHTDLEDAYYWSRIDWNDSWKTSWTAQVQDEFRMAGYDFDSLKDAMVIPNWLRVLRIYGVSGFVMGKIVPDLGLVDHV
ncbi:hypothetical protein K435DRAFT_974339, partial [Dendrothele bispora CBS 962.96]